MLKPAAWQGSWMLVTSAFSGVCLASCCQAVTLPREHNNCTDIGMHTFTQHYRHAAQSSSERAGGRVWRPGRTLHSCLQRGQCRWEHAGPCWQAALALAQVAPCLSDSTKCSQLEPWAVQHNVSSPFSRSSAAQQGPKGPAAAWGCGKHQPMPACHSCWAAAGHSQS